MSAVYPRFFKQPIQYMRWAAHDKPAIFYSVLLGGLSPFLFVVAPPLRRLFGDNHKAEKIPLTYPMPSGPRKKPAGFED